jgi:hypothetical protein
MPANPTRIVTPESDLDFGDSVGVKIPVSALLSALTAEASPQGVVVWNGRTQIKLTGVQDADGFPMQFTVTLRAVRSARNADEAEAVNRAKLEAQGRKDKRTADDSNKRESEIMRTAHIVRQTIIETEAKRGNLAAQVGDAIALVRALGPVVSSKGLPSAE